MGNNQASLETKGGKLTPQLKEKAISLFKKFDQNGSKTIDKLEAVKYWLVFSIITNNNIRKSFYPKLNAEALFKAVDINNNGVIEEIEWINFWSEVKEVGHTEDEISEELDNLNNGLSWVIFKDVNEDRRNKV